VGLRARGQPQALRQFQADDLLGVLAQHDVDVVVARIQVVEQPLRVNRAGGSGDGDEYFQTFRRNIDGSSARPSSLDLRFAICERFGLRRECTGGMDFFDR
jgi:hypothetical protein